MKTRGVVGSVTIIVQFQIRLSRILSPKIQVNPSRSTFQFPRFLPPVQLYIENISSPACCSFSTLLQSDEFPKMQPDYLKYNSDSPKILVKALRKHKRS